MSIPVLARLETVAVRTAWSDEARDFTPWLAENLDRLGEALGLDLVLDAMEVGVGPFRADIVAKDARDGSVVLIENQLEASDNRHLGQIQTYMSGLGAQRVVWVAPRFQDEHLSALKWLNEHTVEPFAFFAVEVSVVRIGDSPLAPLFEVVEKPNGWERSVANEVKKSSQHTEASALRREFWAHLVARHPEMLQDGAPDGSSWRWRKVPEVGLVVSQFFSDDGVGVFIRGMKGRDGRATAPLLKPFEAELTERIGARPGNAYPFSHKFRCVTSDESQWDGMADWLREETARVADIVRDVVKTELTSENE